MNTVTDFNKFTNWIKEKNVSSTRNPEEIEEIDLSKSLIEKAAKQTRRPRKDPNPVRKDQSQIKSASVTDQISQSPEKKRN